MREKELRIIVTFQTTTGAMAMEKACKEDGVEGRLIPVPLEITAGCGLSWSGKPEQRKELKKIMKKHQLIYDNIYELTI